VSKRRQIAVAIVEHDGRFLVGRRAEGVALAGYDEFPGGKVEPGETPEAAAERECLEETGLRVRAVCRYPDVEFDYAHGAISLAFVACRPAESSIKPRDPFVWVERTRLTELRFPPANADLLALLSQPASPSVSKTI